MSTSHFSYTNYEHQPSTYSAPPKPEDDKSKLYRQDIDEVLKYINSDEQKAGKGKTKAKAKKKEVEPPAASPVQEEAEVSDVEEEP
jgi:hypothetical protein